MDIKEFVTLLNQDLNSEFASIAAYTTFAASVIGLHRPELKGMFEEEAESELGHAQYFADKIAALGGFPQIVLQPIPYTRSPQQMVEVLRGMEEQAVLNYSARADQAKVLGLHAIAIDIENILTDEREHFDELSMMLMSV